MNYLKFIELAAENLQFFLWLRAYTKKFNELPESEQALAPEWTMTQSESEKMAFETQARQMKISADTAAAIKGTGLESVPRIASSDRPNPFHTPPRTPSEETNRNTTPSEFSASDEKSMGWTSQNSTTNFKKRAGDAYDEAGLKWQPCKHCSRICFFDPSLTSCKVTIQPFRDEVTRIISIYIADGGARQLNLSSKERTALLHALEHTTHPSAFRNVATTVEWSLRCQAHPNFIRWTICNGNRPRVIFARGLGIGGIIAGIIVSLLITLSNAGRGWRVFGFILFFIGISTLIAAWKGMCVVLHGMHHRHLRPWELFQDEDDITVEFSNDSTDTFASKNSFETEPWVAKYEKRNVIRKIFDRETWVEEPALRQIQDTIFIQSVIGAIIGSAILTAIFVAVPAGHFY